MSLAQPTGRLGRAFKPHRERLLADSFSFAEASLDFARSRSAELASQRMKTALSTWRRDTRAAMKEIEELPRTVRGKTAALRTLQTLDTALQYLNRSFKAGDTGVAAAAAVSARVTMDRYRELSADLEKRLL